VSVRVCGARALMHSLSLLRVRGRALSLSPCSFGLIAELLKICIVLNLEVIATIVYNCSANGGAPKEFLMAECRYNQTTPNVTLLLLFEL
jgi:hypothetical protein